MEFLIQPTTEEVRSTQSFGIPHLSWSPIDERNSVLIPNGVAEYPGAQRAPRLLSVMMVRGREEELPASARLYIQLKVYPEVRDEVTQEIVEEAKYQTLAVLTPDNPEWKRQYPIDPGLLSVLKPESDDAYGAVCFGYFGITASHTE